MLNYLVITIPSLRITGRHPRSIGGFVDRGVGAYPSAEVQSAYSTVPADRTASFLILFKVNFMKTECSVIKEKMFVIWCVISLFTAK